MSRLYAKAVLIGMAGGFLAGALWSVLAAVLAVVFGARAGSNGNLLLSSPVFVAFSLVGSVGSAFVAGWLTARFAPGAETWNAIAVGLLIVFLSAALFIPMGMAKFPLWYNVPAFLLTVPFTWLGGVTRSRKNGK